MRHQKAEREFLIVISSISDMTVFETTKYWQENGIDIKEYFYRFYDINGELLLEISDDYHSPKASKHCWINTCRTFYEKAYIDMIKNSKVSVYGDRIALIDDRMKDCFVFLYHNGEGIIGVGKGSKEIKTQPNHRFAENERERFMKLNSFIHGVNIDSGEIENRITAGEIKALLGRNIFFSNSIVSLTEEEARKLHDRCKSEFKE